jgi:hypothetical protein
MDTELKALRFDTKRDALTVITNALRGRGRALALIVQAAELRKAA